MRREREQDLLLRMRLSKREIRSRERVYHRRIKQIRKVEICKGLGGKNGTGSLEK